MKAGDKKPTGKAGKIIDYVANDKDRRDMIITELRYADAWEKDWGFLADDTNSERMKTKNEKIQFLEEKLKKMDTVKITSTAKQNFRGGDIDFRTDGFNKRKNNELQPCSRRPDKYSKAFAHLVEKVGEDFKTKPYDNFLGSK